MAFNMDSLIQRASKLQIRSGIFGMLTWTIVIFTISVSGVAYSFTNEYLKAAIIMMVIAVVIYVLNWLMKFTEKYPHIAVLFGSDLITHERMMLASKDGGPLPIEGTTVDHAQPDVDVALIEEEEKPKRSRKPKQIEGSHDG